MEADDMPPLPPRDDGNVWLWIVYDHPADMRTHWVVRPQTFDRSAADAAEVFRLVIWPHAYGFETLQKARAFCEQFGLVNIGRYAEDDPVIAEVWV